MGQRISGIYLICPAGFEVKDSGPLRVAEFDCHGCEAPSTLTDSRCRKCVLSRLRTEGEVDQVILIRAICKIYCSRDLSKLARVIATAEQLALDRTLYVAKEEKNCKKCVDGRIAVVMGALDQITTNPHDLKPLDDVVADARKKLKGGCMRLARREKTRTRWKKVSATILTSASGQAGRTPTSRVSMCPPAMKTLSCSCGSLMAAFAPMGILTLASRM
jgi:hypothetical protein